MKTVHLLLIFLLAAIVLADNHIFQSHSNLTKRTEDNPQYSTTQNIQSEKTVIVTKTKSHRLPKVGSIDIGSLYPFVDHQLRQKYWYYLTKACLIFRAEVERGDSYQFLAIYRNIVGTFLAITTWKNQTKEIQVNTLVRLGNGYQKGSEANYPPVNLRALSLKYLLGKGQFLIKCDDSGDVSVNGKVLSDDLDENINVKHHSEQTHDQLVQKCSKFSAFAQKRFWYYLERAEIVYSSVGITNEKCYCLITYLNEVGTFLVIGNHEETEDKSVVDTFVRLGNGYEEGSEANYKPVNFSKISLQLKDYEE